MFHQDLAEHELYVADFYYKTKRYQAAIDRYQGLIQDYPRFPENAQAKQRIKELLCPSCQRRFTLTAWQEGFIRGLLHPNGYGPTVGYPVVELGKPVESIRGFLFISGALPGYWPTLDDFEGEGYRRVKTIVTLQNTSRLEAFTYALDTNLLPSGIS